MAFCKKCGTMVQDGIQFCPKCGTATQTQTTQKQVQAQANDAEANKIMAVISYLGFLFLIPLIMGKHKNSPFLTFHMNQAIVLCIGWIVPTIAGIIPFVGVIINLAFSVALVTLMVMGIISVLKGQMKSLPVIGNIKILK